MKVPPLIIVFLTLHLCVAQAPAGHIISGVLQDQSGAVIVGAEIVLLDQDGSTKASTATNDAGEFLFRVDKTGSYVVRVQQQGFKETTLAVSVGEVPRINVRMVLTVSASAEQVNVGANEMARRRRPNRRKREDWSCYHDNRGERGAG